MTRRILNVTVGVLLVTYGTFWTGEGLRVRWPGGDSMLLGLAAIYAVVTWLFVQSLRRETRVQTQRASA